MVSDPTAGGVHEHDRRLLVEPSRQSPIAFVFIAWRFVRRLGLSALAAAALFVFNGGLAIGTLLLAVAFAIGLLVYAALSWWQFTFAIVDDELVVTKGIVSVERLVIPLDRVQSVSIDQLFTHRIVGLVRATVDTAGSSDVEFEIDAIDRPRAEALRRVVADARRTATVVSDDGTLPPPRLPPSPDEIVLQRTLGELVRVGATRMPWAGLALLAPLIALGEELDGYVGLGVRVERLAERGQGVGGDAIVVGAAAVIALVVVGTLAGAVLQVAREILANWNLTLYRTPTGLRRTAGLLNTTSRSSTARRVQMITTDDTPPQRWLGFTTLKLHTFGAVDFGLPGSSDAEVRRIRRLVFGDMDRPSLDRSISRWLVFKATRNMAVIAALAGAAFWFAAGWWSALTLLAVPIEWAAASRRWRLRRWGLNDHAVAESYQFVSRHTGEAPLFKAQTVVVRQSFFERRRGLATVRMNTSSGFLAIPLIDVTEANIARDRIVHAVETDRRRAL